jgi:hypothetical protein
MAIERKAPNAKLLTDFRERVPDHLPLFTVVIQVDVAACTEAPYAMNASLWVWMS